ncbi:MAG: response regulator transcription factor [Acidobacteriia bacterium]|nr:response regulator transcription factor [Terriglobia bacterium]MBV8903630.1 response regulator transcription factor [Terriglobia bacterium]MBV9746343.1 response regulator transcription factor [Terriglobia bacterium]
MRKTRVLLADDHAVVAQGLEALLKDAFDLVGVVHDGRALLEAAQKLKPDVIVTDISMPLLNGIDAVKQIRASLPQSKVVILTMHADTQLAVKAFRAGASGYVLKISPGDEFITAINQVAQGRAYVTPLLAKNVIDVLIEAGGGPRELKDPLSARQREVLQLIAEGRTMKEIAAILHISPRTAESHKYEIMQVLGLETTAQLVQYAIREKLVSE